MNSSIVSKIKSKRNSWSSSNCLPIKLEGTLSIRRKFYYFDKQSQQREQRFYVYLHGLSTLSRDMQSRIKAAR